MIFLLEAGCGVASLCFLFVVFIFLSSPFFFFFSEGGGLFCSLLLFSFSKDGLKLDLLIVHPRHSQESSEW